MSATSEFAKPVTLRDLANLFAANNPRFNYFHGRLYSFIPPEREKFLEFTRTLQLRNSIFPNNHPATIIVGNLGSLVPLQSRQVLALRDRQLQISAQISDLKLPDFEYLAIIAPVEGTQSSKNYGLARESMSFLRSLVALPFGKLPFYTWIADFDFDGDGKLALPGDVVRMPLYGDLFTFLDLPFVDEIARRLSLQQEGYRGRLQRAMNFFSGAINQSDEAFRFSSYWIALEIIAGGKSDAIRSKLAKAYGQQNKRFCDDNLLFREIEGLRNRLIHHGEFGILKSYQERLMQLYFWDVVIHQIGLQPRRLAKLFVDSGMVDAEKDSKELRKIP